MSNLANPRNYLPDDGDPKLLKLKLTLVPVAASEVDGALPGAGAAVLARYEGAHERGPDGEMMVKPWRAPITAYEPGLDLEAVSRNMFRIGLLMVAPDLPNTGKPERRAITIVAPQALIDAAQAALKSPTSDNRWTEMVGALKRCETVTWVPAVHTKDDTLGNADIDRAHALAVAAIKVATTRLRGRGGL